MFFNNIPVSGADSQKRLRLHLDFKKLPLDTHQNNFNQSQ